MKIFYWISLIIAAIVIVNEFAYINTSSLAWVLISLAISVILMNVVLIAGKR